jgi:CDGSH-type Zn-finger protein
VCAIRIEVEQEKVESPKSPLYRVKVTTNGPYVVSGGAPLAEQTICVGEDGQPHGWNESRRYPGQESYTLCRCGHSQRQPYCDGGHEKIEFDGTETAPDTPYLEQAAEFDGPDLRLTDAELYCSGAGFCRRGGGTWNLTRHSADPEAKQTAVEEACECPSGRLVAWERDGQAIEPNLEPSIGLVQDAQTKTIGPIWVRGGIPVESADGETYEVRNRVTLCRCGRSSNKPFCDRSHED